MASPRRPPVDAAPQNSAFGPAARGGIILLGAVLIGVLLIGADKSPSSASGGGAAIPEVETTTTALIPAETTTTAPARDYKAVAVLVANGSAVNGAARRVQEFLLETYNLLDPVDAKPKPQSSAIFARPGYEDVVKKLNEQLGTNLQMLPLDSSVPVVAREAARAQVVLIVGADLAEQFRNRTSTAETTTTVAPV
jgi:hypothetical protein